MNPDPLAPLRLAAQLRYHNVIRPEADRIGVTLPAIWWWDASLDAATLTWYCTAHPHDIIPPC